MIESISLIYFLGIYLLGSVCDPKDKPANLLTGEIFLPLSLIKEIICM